MISEYHHRIIIFLLAAIFIALLPPTVAARNYVVNPLTVADGLSQSSVTAIFRDSRGFLWIGTRYGLNRYDNRSLQTFYAKDGLWSDKSNMINNIFEDAEGRIWILGLGATSIYDPKTDSFSEFLYEGEPLGIGGYLLEDDGILFGLPRRFMRYSYRDKSYMMILPDVSKIVRASYGNLFPWKNGHYLVQTRWKGILDYNPADTTVVRVDFVKGTTIWATVIDAQKRLWVAALNDGVHCYDPNGNLVKHFTPADGLSTDHVTSLLELGGQMLVGSEKGIDVIDLETLRVVPGGLSGTARHIGSILSLYGDDYGNVYAGTVRNGLMMIQNVAMRTFRPNQSATGVNTVMNFVPGRQNELLCAIDGGGVTSFNTLTTELHTFPSTEGMKIISLAQWPGDKVLMVDYINGFSILNLNTGKISEAPYELRNLYFSSRAVEMGADLCNMRPGMIAIVTDSIHFVDVPQGRVHRAEPVEGLKMIGKAYPFYHDRDRLIATQQNRIIETRRSTLSIDTLLTSPDGQEFKTGAYDGNHTIYAATADTIYCCDLSTGRIEPMRIGSIENIGVILLDGGRLWVGASNRLFMIENRRVFTFNSGEGLTANEYIPTAVMADSTSIYLGGSYGFARIYRDQVDSLSIRRDQSVKLSLSQVYLNGQPAMAQVRDGHLSVPAVGAAVTVWVINREISPMRSKLYRFWLKGFGMDSEYIESLEPRLNIQEPNPGRSGKIYVSCTLPDGSWSNPTLLLTLDVRQVWYKSWWFILIVCTLLVVAGLFWLRSDRQRRRIRATRLRQRTLEHEVQLLANINETLNTPLREISKPLSSALESARRHPDEVSDVVVEKIEEALQGAEDMQDMLNRTINLIHPDSISAQSVDMTARFNVWLGHLFDNFVKAHSVDLRLGIRFAPDYDPGTITFDATRLESIFTNLLTEFVNGDNVSLRVGVVEEPDCKGVIRVTIEAVRKETTLRRPGHNDIRVSFAKSLAEHAGMTVACETDDEDRLVRASVDIPEENVGGGEAVVEAVDKNETEQIFGSDKVLAEATLLIASADRGTVDMLTQRLGSYFADLIVSTNSAEALSDAVNAIPDIAIVDTDLPGIGGVEVSHRIKAESDLAATAVILMASSGGEFAADQSARSQADAVVARPVDPDTLLKLCVRLMFVR
ncbi:MAG: response regulator [Clostridium sp.]|nr:response regulator [Clostridium sp.]